MAQKIAKANVYSALKRATAWGYDGWSQAPGLYSRELIVKKYSEELSL